jgi:hypothetical protein
MTFAQPIAALQRAVLLASLACVSAFASPITVTITGTGGSGAFAGAPFSDAAFTLVATGDTSTLASRLFDGDSEPSILLTSMTYTIGGNPVATATGEQFFLADTTGFVGNVAFANSGFTASNVWSQSHWDLTSDLTSVPITFRGFGGFATDQGVVRLTGWSSATLSAVVEASTVPEPSSALLVLAGLCLAGVKYKHARAGNESRL